MEAAALPVQISYKQLVDSIEHFGLVLVDRDGEILAWNRGASRLLGYMEEEAVGRLFSHFFPGDEEKRRGERLLRDASGSERLERGGFLRRKDGVAEFFTLILTPSIPLCDEGPFVIIIRHPD